MALGTLAAVRLWHVQSHRLRQLRWLVVALAAVPPYMHGLTWNTAAAFVTRTLHLGGASGLTPQGWVAAWWVQTMALLPLAVVLALLGFEAIHPRLVEAGRVQRGDLAVLGSLGIPLAGPMVLAGAGLLFVLSLLDYTVPGLYNLNVYALDVFAEFSASGDPARALVLSVPLLIVAAVVVYFSQATWRNAAVEPARGRRAWSTPPAWPRWFAALETAALAVLGLQVVVLCVTLAGITHSAGALVTGVSAAGDEVVFSALVAALAAVCCLPLAVVAARGMAAEGWWSRTWWLLVMLPLAVPAPLVGIGLIALWNRPVAVEVYGTTAMPVLAALARFTPFAALVMLAQVRRIDVQLLEAARLLRPGRLAVGTRIWLPLAAPGLVAAAAVCFALTIGELGATLVVAPPGRATVTMRVYNLLHYGATDQVAGLSLTIVVVTLAAALLAAAVLVLLRRHAAGGG